MKSLLFFIVLLFGTSVAAQSDSISIDAQLSKDKRQLNIHQKITFYNRENTKLDSLKLLNWIAAYQSKSSPLAKRKLEDRDSKMYFAQQKEFGKLEKLSIKIDGQTFENDNLQAENVFIPLPKSLESGDKFTLFLDYTLQLPDSKFTGYGYGEDQCLLKYFFLTPDQLLGKQNRNFLDIDEVANYNTYWDIRLQQDFSEGFVYSNLDEISPTHFAGLLSEDPEILISKIALPSFQTEIDGEKILINLGYPVSFYENSRIGLNMNRQLQFIKNNIGDLPHKILITEKFKNKEDFFGNDDVKFWRFRFPLFSPNENLDMDYFSIFSKKITLQSLVVNKQDHHWITNGLKSYLEGQYLQLYYKDTKLVGQLSESISLWGLQPLNWFYASRLKLVERYGLAYQYMVSQNLDQAIATPFSQLSNFNDLAMSHSETGSLLMFLADKEKSKSLDIFFKKIISTHKNKLIDGDVFIQELSLATHYSSDFLLPYIQKKQRVNFKINKFKREGKNLLVDITKNTELAVPFRLDTQTKNSNIQRQYWFDTSAKKSREIYVVPDSAVSKITINKDYLFPESNFRDNYLYTQGFFSNAKKLKIKLLKDIPNPEYNEIYLNPRLSFNIYDQLLFGVNFSNLSLFPRPFSYSLTPYYSTGTGQVTGSGALAYSFLPANSFFNNFTTSISGSVFHYAPQLSYQKYSASTSMLFSKDPRSSIGQSVFAAYTYYQKDLNALMILNNEYDKYNIWSVGYGFSDRKMIHEKSLGISLQGMEDFKKITAEAYYRWEYARNKKVSFRVFAGAFLENKTRNNFFDFGISRVSNYSFSYGLFGQGETDGFWSQQFVLAEGGFKSIIPKTANQWISTVNVDAHIWKMFNLYADAGLFKSKGWDSQFIWDSGVKLKIIPDFIELYFPVQSSLGFEPSFKDYSQRIRFSLSLNLNAIIGSARRGWF